MIQYKEQQATKTETNENGDIKLHLADLANFDSKNPKLRTFALAQLKPGEEVKFHKHEGECEYYYFISGVGLFDDNGQAVEIKPGMATYTPSGSSHGVKNTGDEMLEFIALIVKD